MFIGLIFWSFVWGVWGTLLAVPMLVAVKACCDRIDDLKPIGELLGVTRATVKSDQESRLLGLTTLAPSGIRALRFHYKASRSVRPRAARSGFQRSPTFAIRVAHVVEPEVLDA